MVCYKYAVLWQSTVVSVGVVYSMNTKLLLPDIIQKNEDSNTSHPTHIVVGDLVCESLADCNDIA